MCDEKGDKNCIHYKAVTYNITLKQCPQRLSSQTCTCYLLGKIFKHCHVRNGVGYFLWNRTVWVSTTNDGGVVYAKYCPFDYCNKSQEAADESIDIDTKSELQFANQQTGKLCGKCKLNESYSLAIGSCRCAKCKNDNHSFSLQLLDSCSCFSSVLSLSL